MKYKAFALDLDGTLLVGEELPADNIKALQRAKAQGIEVMLATARWSQIAERTAQLMGISDLVIACSGAQVRDPKTGVDIFDHRRPA
ncbi:MAG: HAD hydrolase family protein [Pseudomonadales bacterium]